MCLVFRFQDIPYDSLIQFVRGYATYADHEEEILKRLTNLMEWRKTEGIDNIVGQWDLDPNQANFNKYYQTAPIGLYFHHPQPVIAVSLNLLMK